MNLHAEKSSDSAGAGVKLSNMKALPLSPASLFFQDNRSDKLLKGAVQRAWIRRPLPA